MKVATRLNLAILPAIVGLLVVAALAYWGDRGRQAPEFVLMLAIVATIGSAVLSWRATRQVSRRVGDLATEFRALGLNVSLLGAHDEFEELSRVRESVRALADDQTRLRDLAATAVRNAEREQQQFTAVLERTTLGVTAQLEEARLALHILQTSPFGELNENQEELVSAARLAADEADRDLRRLTRLVGMPARRRTATRETLAVEALLEPALATCAATAEDRHVTVRRDLTLHLPPVLVDRLATQEALSLLLHALAESCPTEGELAISADERDGQVLLRVRPGLPAENATALPVLLAAALLDGQSATIDVQPDAVSVCLPIPPSTVWRTGFVPG